MKKKLQVYLKTKWPAILWSVIVFILLVLPEKQMPGKKLFDIPHFDKLVHALAFGLLVFLWAFYYKSRVKTTQFIKILLILAISGTIYGVLMEYVQLWAGRDFDVWDMVADAAGAFGAAFFLKISPGRDQGRNQN